MTDQRHVLRHFLATLAYRTQRALNGAPEDFGVFQAGNGVRTPIEILRHMTSVLGYGRTFFTGGEYRAEKLPDLDAEIARFHRLLASVAVHLAHGTRLADETLSKLLQGPLSDAMTHVGQLAMLRSLHGTAVPAENFAAADIDPERLGPA